METPDGRIIKIMNQPMPDGGWVATHEDITLKVAAENELRKQEEQLNAALENISQGVCMFDASQRLIVCNKQYADIYGLDDEQTKPGTPLHAILENRIANGNTPEDYETYIRDRLNEVSVNQPYQTINRLKDGRYVAVVHRPMGNGGWVATHQDITEAARRLQTAAEGAYLARIGGDEFILVLESDALPDSAETLGERFLAAFKSDFVISA